MPEPANVVASVTSDSSPVIDWSDSATVSNYFVEWGRFTQGTGATIILLAFLIGRPLHLWLERRMMYIFNLNVRLKELIHLGMGQLL